MAQKGAQAGQALGESVVKGLASHVSDVVQQGQTIVERLRSLFGSTPIEIPVRLNGAQAIGQAQKLGALTQNNTFHIHGVSSPQKTADLNGRAASKALRTALADVGLTVT